MGPDDQAEILLVEDNPDDADLTMRALAMRNLTNKVFRVRNGEEALEFLFGTGTYAGHGVRSSIRLILLDLKMPKVDGLEVLRRVRGDERTATLPVIVMTSSLEGHDHDESTRLGANSFLAKPVAFDHFLKAVSDAGLYWTADGGSVTVHS